jgi:hypothetical protein
MSHATLVPADDSPQKAPSDPQTSAALVEKFSSEMNGVKLVGRFTVVGRDDGPLVKEEYTIQKVEKLPEGDKWLIHARIKYGNHDVTVPLPLDVKWAGKTAVITLDNLAIPGLGTFSSRVVIDDGKYAGTWRHDQVGGHLFGVIEKLPEEAGTDAGNASQTGKVKK